MIRIYAVCLLLVMTFSGFTQELSKDEKDEGFVSLFNGENLKGWIDEAKGWEVDDGGTLVCKKRPKEPFFRTLLTERNDYSDFILRLDYLLNENCNNGIGLRIDPKNNPNLIGGANAVLEVQLVDDKHVETRYAKEKNRPDYKTKLTGGLYGLKAAEQGAQKPIDNWNKLEIVAKGVNIRVSINGKEVLNAEVDPKSTYRSQNRKSGAIGLLGWQGKAEFRNIRIKELK